jgi:hypothetical protein
VFDVLAPTGDRHPLTEDTDWLGSRKDAQWLCDLLGKDAELHLPDPSDSTPSSGLAFIERPGQRVIMMDFLRTIAGLENSEIEKLAVSIALKGVTLRVLHPLLCLESRMANLAILPSKRRGNGPMQAEWAINIAAAFLRKSLAADTTQAANGCRRIAELAEFKHGKYCYLNFGIDPLKAVPKEVVDSINGGFASQEWPRTVARIEGKRLQWRRQQALQDLRRRQGGKGA